MRLIGLAVIVLGAMMTVATNAPVANGQMPSRLPLIAILEVGSASMPSGGVARFKRALGELGWVEGRAVRIETRYGDWRPDRLAAMAKELVSLKPDVIYTHSDTGLRATISATTSIPIVVVASDLLRSGAVRSLAQPGGNVTGMSLAMPELDWKRLEVLKETVPSISAVAFLFSTGTIETVLTGLDDSARRLGIRLHRVAMSEPGELDAAFVAIAKSGSHAVLVQDAPLFARQVDRVAVLALKYRLPAISQMPRFDETGGLLWYGADVFDMFRRSAAQVDKILKGAKPGDIPVEQPTKVELVVNLKTAKALGVTIPPAIMVRADRVIQ
jgi:putative tryptophan/tyrosine transport system substrate-binding protein